MRNPTVSSHGMQKKIFQLRIQFIPESNVTNKQIGLLQNVHICTLARHLVTYRHPLKSIKVYLLEENKLSQIHPLAVYCIYDAINSSCFSIIHES